MVRIVAFSDVAANLCQRGARVKIEGDTDEGTLGLGRFFLEAGNLGVVVHSHHAVFGSLLKRADIVYPEHWGLGFATASAKTAEISGKQVVAGYHKEVFVDALLFDHQMQIADGAQSVLVAGGTVVDHGAGAMRLGCPPILKVARKFFIGDDVGVVNAANGLTAGEHVL